jgi:hypothetical protein
MATIQEQRAEEQQAIERERRTFDRRQEAFIKVTGQFTPHGNGAPAQADMDELEAADAEWRAANAEVERITDEIRTGKRR